MVDFADNFNQYSISKLPTFRDDFTKYVDQPSADLAWASADVTKNRVNIATDVLDLNILRDNTNDSIVHDLGSTISDSNWVLRFKLIIDTLNLTAFQTQGFFGLFDGDETEGEEEPNQNSIGVALTALTGTLTYRLFSSEETTITAGQSTIFAHALAVETVYVEIKRNSKTTYEVNLYSDASFSTLIESQQGISTAGTIGLRFIGMKNNASMTVGSSILGSMDDVEFWDSGKQIIFQDDFSSGTGWVPVANDVGGVSVTGGQLTGWGSDGGITREIFYDLIANNRVTISDTNWIAEFDFQYTIPSTSSNPGHSPFTLSDSTATTDSFQTSGPATPSVPHPRSISMQVNNQNAFNIDRGVQIVVKDTTTTTSSAGVSGLAGIIDLDGFANTTVFVRLERTSATTYKLSVFTDSARTIHVTGTASGADSPVTLTSSQVVTSTNFIHSSNNSAGGAGRVLTGFLDNLVISETGSGGNTEGTVTFQDDFSGTDDWADAGSLIGVNVTTDVIDWDVKRDGTNHKTVFDLGAGNVSDENWALRFKLTVDQTVTPTTSNSNLYIGIGDQDQTVGGTSTTHEALFMEANVGVGGGAQYRFKGIDNEALNASAEYTFTKTVTAETVFIEIARLSRTAGRMTIYSDADYTTILEQSSVITFPATSDGYRFIFLSNLNTGSSDGELNGTIDDVEFYNAVSVALTPIKSTLPDFEDFFWEDNWTQFGSKIVVNTSTQVVDCNWLRDSFGHDVTFDLNSIFTNGVNPNGWGLRFKLKVNTAVGGNNDPRAMVWLTELASGSATGLNQDHATFILLHENVSGDLIISGAVDDFTGTITGTSFPVGTNLLSIGDTIYCEMIRNKNFWTISVYSDPDYTQLLGRGSIDDEGVSTVPDLRYLKIGQFASSINVGGAFTGTVDKIQFWNGNNPTEHGTKWVEVNL